MTHMNSDQAFAVIEKIASMPGKNDKQAAVKSALAFETFKRVLTAALDPLTTYGMAVVPDRVAGAAPGGNTFENAPVWETLDKLAKRELTGNAARDEVQRLMTFLTESSAELFKRIIRKDLRAGFSESTVNKAWPKLIPEFPYMRCSLINKAKFDTWTWDTGVFSQEKADGMFVNLDHEVNGVVRITSRQGSPFPIEAFPGVVTDARSTLDGGTQNHGEMLVYVDGVVAAREIGNGIMNRVAAGGEFAANEVPVFFAWDQIPLTAVQPKGKLEVGYRDRFKRLLTQVALKPANHIRIIPTRVVHSFDEAMVHYRHLLDAGKEGTVIKNGTAIWKDGTSQEQIKLKLEVDVDLQVIGVVPGRAGTKNEGRAGSLACATSCGELLVDVTIKNEEMRDDVDAAPEKWIGGIMPVRANSIMRPSESSEFHSLFLPRFVEAEARTDKSVADSLVQVIAQFEAAVKGA
jgi:DNA ligase-1